MILGVEAPGGEAYLDEVGERLETPSGLRFLLEGRMYHYGKLRFYRLEPNFPKVYYLGVGFILAAIMFQDWIGAWSLFGYIPGALMLSSVVFWWSGFYKGVFRLGLRLKAKGVKPTFYGREEVLKVVLDGTR